MNTHQWVINKEACRELTEKKFSDEQRVLLQKMAEELEQEIEGRVYAISNHGRDYPFGPGSLPGTLYFRLERGSAAVAKVGDILRRKQPEVYALLMAWAYVAEAEDPDRAFREIEAAMRHDGYVRGHGGGIRQVRRG